MKKKDLKAKVESFNGNTKEAIETIIASITAQGQRKKLLKNGKVQAILNRYGINLEEV